jgi:hypothetical protein
MLAAQSGEVSAEEAWNSLRGGDKIKLAGGGWARVQEAATGEENANRPADAGVEETPATVPALSPLPTFLDTGTTAGDEGMESQRKNRRHDGRSRSPSESTNDRRRKKGRAKEENADEGKEEISDPIQCTQYSTRRREVLGQPSFHEMQAAKAEEQKTKGTANTRKGAGWVNRDARWRQGDLGREAPRTPPWKKDEPEDGDKAEPVDGGEETANEGIDWDFDEEADLVRRSAGEEPFCG